MVEEALIYDNINVVVVDWVSGKFHYMAHIRLFMDIKRFFFFFLFFSVINFTINSFLSYT